MGEAAGDGRVVEVWKIEEGGFKPLTRAGEWNTRRMPLISEVRRFPHLYNPSLGVSCCVPFTSEVGSRSWGWSHGQLNCVTYVCVGNPIWTPPGEPLLCLLFWRVPVFYSEYNQYLSWLIHPHSNKRNIQDSYWNFSFLLWLFFKSQVVGEARFADDMRAVSY